MFADVVALAQDGLDWALCLRSYSLCGAELGRTQQAGGEQGIEFLGLEFDQLVLVVQSNSQRMGDVFDFILVLSGKAVSTFCVKQLEDASYRRAWTTDWYG